MDKQWKSYKSHAAAGWGTEREEPSIEGLIYGAVMLLIDEIKGLREDMDPDAKAAKKAKANRRKIESECFVVKMSAERTLEQHTRTVLTVSLKKSLPKWMWPHFNSLAITTPDLPRAHEWPGTVDEYCSACGVVLAAYMESSPLPLISAEIKGYIEKKPTTKRGLAWRAILDAITANNGPCSPSPKPIKPSPDNSPATVTNPPENAGSATSSKVPPTLQHRCRSGHRLS